MTTDKQQAINAGAFTLVEKTIPLIRSLLEKQMRAVLEAASAQGEEINQQLVEASHDTVRIDFLDAMTTHEVAELAMFAQNEFDGDLRAAIDLTMRRKRKPPT